MEKVIRGDLHDKKPSNENTTTSVPSSSASNGPVLLAPSVMNKNKSSTATPTNENKPENNTKRQSRIHLNDDDNDGQPKKLLGNSDAALLNFQRASCTLDASIKIWSYRVDDVYNTSYRVLENLSRKNPGKDGEDTNDTNNDNNDDESNNDPGHRTGTNSKANASSVSSSRTVGNGAVTTIEKNIHNITTKRIEADYDVDPLFHKLSAENGNNDGGASGMLLNRLAVYSGCDLAFDSTETLDIDNMMGTDYNLTNLVNHSNTLSIDESTVLRNDLTRNLTKTDVITAEVVLTMLSSQIFTPSLDTLYTNLHTFATAIGDTKTVNLLSPHAKNKGISNNTNNSNAIDNNTPSHLLHQLDGNNSCTTSGKKSSSSTTISTTATNDNPTSAWSAVAILTERMENNNNDSMNTDTNGSSSSSSSSKAPNPIIMTAIPMEDLSTIDDVLANAVPVTVTNDTNHNDMDDIDNNWVGGDEPDNYMDDGNTTIPSSMKDVQPLGLVAMAPASTGAMAEYSYVDLSVLSSAVATGTNSNQSMNHWKLRTAALEAANQLENNKGNSTNGNGNAMITKDNLSKTTGKGTKTSKRKGVFTINFGPENKIPSDAFSKAKVPLTVGGNKGTKGGILRDAEQMTVAAIEKCEKNTSNNAYLLPKIRQHLDPITLRNTGLFALTDHILSLSFKPQIRINARTLTSVTSTTNGIVGDVFFTTDNNHSSNQHTGFNNHLDNEDNGGNDFFGNDDDGGYDDMPMVTSSTVSSSSLAGIDPSSSTGTAATTTNNNNDPIELVAAGRQVEKIRVRYETVAKRVDVAALKSDMLHLLCPELPSSSSSSSSSALVPLKLRTVSHKTVENDFRAKGRANEKNFTDTSGAAVVHTTVPSGTAGSSSSTTSTLNLGGAQFSDAIKALAPEMSSQVTVPFYFITLLHLANEHGLALNGRNDLSDFEIGKLTP